MSATKTQPPGPRGRLLSGNLRDYIEQQLDFFIRCRERYGDIVRLRFGYRTIWLVSHPDLIEQVLVTDAKHYIKHFGARLYRPVLGNGLVLSEGDFWLRQRKLAQPAFLKSKLHQYAEPMIRFTEQLLARWQENTVVEVHEEMVNLTGQIAASTLFGVEAPEDRLAFNDAMYEAFNLMSLRLRRPVPLPDWLPTPNNIRLARAVRRLNAVVDGFIAAGRRRGADGHDLLSVLLRARDEGGEGMTDRQLRDEIMTLFLAGHETTALTLSWAWYLLAQHPHVEERLVAEWREVLNGRPPTPDDLARLPYTEAVILEAMRIYPPVWLLGRQAIRPCELGGYSVRPGTTIFMSQWVMHRHPDYFPEPTVFRPERWLDGLAKRLPKFAYFPFGGGPRVCIGNTFSMMEAGLILPMLGQSWRFTHDPTQPVSLQPMITLQPKPGIYARLSRR